MDPNGDRLREIEAQMQFLSRTVVRMNRMLVDMSTLIQQMHQRHLEELKACHRSYTINVEAQKELEEAIRDSGDPWN